MSGDVDVDDLLGRLERLRARESELIADLGEVSEERAEELHRAHRRVVRLLDDYQDRATGTGDFGGYVEFRAKFGDLVEDLPEDLPSREAFEEALEAVERRRLSTGDFERARSALSPVAAVVDTVDELASVRDERDEVRQRLLATRDRLESRRRELEDLASVQPDAVDVPVQALREPIERYNDAIRADFQRFRRERPVRDVLATYRRLKHFPLLGVDPPPDPLWDYLEDDPVGDEPIPTVLEYLSYSRSKLDHYVDDPGTLQGEVRPYSGYLERLTAEPYTIAWPPPPRSRFRWRLRELSQAVDRFADEETVATLRSVQALCRDGGRYDRLRSGAVMRTELSERQRELVISGNVEERLATVTDRLEAIEAGLERA